MWQFASATQYNFTMLDIDTSDVSLNSYYDLDKGIVDVHANACFQGAALRLPGPRPPRAMHSPPPALLLLQGSPSGGDGAMPFAGSSAPLRRAGEGSRHGWGPTGGKPEQQEGWTHRTAQEHTCQKNNCKPSL